MDSIYSYLDYIDITLAYTDSDIEKWIKENKYKHLGFDTESKICYNSNSENHKLALIQICNPDSCVLIPVYGNTKINDFLKLMLESSETKKYCVNPELDIRVLKNARVELSGIIDVNNYPFYKGSMKTLAEKKLGLRMEKSKNIQCSDWSKTPLSIKQLRYAAMDAIVSLALVEPFIDQKKLVRKQSPILDNHSGNRENIIISIIKKYITNKKYIQLDELCSSLDIKRIIATKKDIIYAIENDSKNKYAIIDNYIKQKN